MKIELKNGGEKLYLKLRFDRKEVEKINRFFEKGGFRRGKVKNLWGEGIERECWIDTENRFFQEFVADFGIKSDIFNLINDLNYKFLKGNELNLAIFRTLVEENEVVVGLSKFLTVKEFKEIIRIFKEVMEKIFNLIIEEEIVVELKSKVEND